ncbi:MAG: hypothetical protein Q8M31_06770 [Beijerinckiaceae bacterium]|nr:hypothetical protein [Beijerinckiaceae bacterium]
MAKRTSKKKTSKVLPASVTAKQTRALARTIEEALELLEEHYPNVPEKIGRPAAPLPSLLERCEALVIATEVEQPRRIVFSFTEADEQVSNSLLAVLPNLRSMRWIAPGACESGVRDGALEHGAATGCDPDLLTEAKAATFEALEAKQRLRGQSVVLSLITRTQYVDPAGKQFAEWALRGLQLQRPTAAMIAACHPLQSWLEARHRGRLGFSPARLEDFAERYLAFLNNHDGLPTVTSSDIAADPATAIARFANALKLPLSDYVRQEAASFQPEDLLPRQEPGGPMLRDVNGAPATDEPLDTPAYCELCARLGFDPADLTPAPEQAFQLETQPVLRRSTHRLKRDTPRARITNLLPRVAMIASAAGTSSEPPHRLVDAATLVELVEDCLANTTEFYNRLDHHLAGLSPADGALLLIGCAGHYAVLGDTNHALNLIAEAVEIMPTNDRALQLLASDVYLQLRKPEMAIDILTHDARHGSMSLPAAQRDLLDRTLANSLSKKPNEHGHALLIDHLTANPPAPLPRRRVLIEIGTTRERLPGQGSTEKLARVCAHLGMDFITVDMDPRNSRLAQRMFRQLGLPFRAVTARGEDFLAAWDGPIDYCFLDAYDFDHGMHSEFRQSRYEAFLGSRISEMECHEMHLACARSLVTKLAPDGVICFDDTWLDANGAWTAKGTTAMPFLLDNGFLIQFSAKNSAVVTRQ